jgi:hypothetical protein
LSHAVASRIQRELVKEARANVVEHKGSRKTPLDGETREYAKPRQQAHPPAASRDEMTRQVVRISETLVSLERPERAAERRSFSSSTSITRRVHVPSVGRASKHRQVQGLTSAASSSDPSLGPSEDVDPERPSVGQHAVFLGAGAVAAEQRAVDTQRPWRATPSSQQPSRSTLQAAAGMPGVASGLASLASRAPASARAPTGPSMVSFESTPVS